MLADRAPSAPGGGVPALTSRPVANHKKTRKPRTPQHHLPKVGTPADDAYRQRRSREDVVDFGLGSRGRSPLMWVIAVVIVLAVVAGVVGLIALTA